MTNPFVWCLLACNLGASVWFLAQGNGPWALIYGGAACIQAGCLWAR